MVIIGSIGCANILPPGGGPRDTIPPVLVNAVPRDSATNTTPNRVTLYFNEFVEIQNAMENVVISPLPNNLPNIDFRLRTVTIRLRDTLESNTTYSINFGDAIRDVNEGNVMKNFVYVFSTGSTIDSNSLSGKVVLAETGKLDTTMIVVLHRNLDDSAVAKEKPRYMARLNGQGNFLFQNLPAGTFALYAITNDYGRRYDDTTKLFAFAGEPINTGETNNPVILYAYNYPKAATPQRAASNARPGPPNAAAQDKNLRYTTSLEAGGIHDVLKPTVDINFNRHVVRFDTASAILTDKDFTALNGFTIVADTNRTTFHVNYPWATGQEYRLLLSQGAFSDSSGNTLAKNDTIKISTKKNEDYGSVKLRFTNLNLDRNPVLQLVQSDKVVLSSPLTGRDWSRKLFPPGDYEIRILYDTNKNGQWDPGSFFWTRRQPEIVTDLKIKLTIRGNWDNEKEITL